MDNLNHYESQKKFDELCGFKNYYVPYKFGIKEPLHAFMNLEPAKAFTEKELMRSCSYAIRPGFNNLICIDPDYKKEEEKGALDLPERFRKTYCDETTGGKHYWFIMPNGIPSYWKNFVKQTQYNFDLFVNKNTGVAHTNCVMPNKYYRNICYMPPQILPQELFDEIDSYQQKNKIVKKDNKNKIKKSSKINHKQLRKMLNMLPIKYFDDGMLWKKMCWIIHFETKGSDEGFELFEEMSRKVERYKDLDQSIHIREWENANKVNTKQLTIASLIQYLRNEGFQDKDFMCRENYIGHLVQEAINSESNFDMAKLALGLREGDVGYFKEDKKIMFWNGVYWKYEELSNKSSIKSIVFKDCLKEMYRKRKEVTNAPMEKVETDKQRKEQQERKDNYLQKINDLINKIKSNNFCEATASIIIDKLKTDYIITDINKADDYFCFNNKVWDLNNACWIDPNKIKHLYNTLYSPFDYREPTEEENKTLEKIYSQIQTDDITRREFFKIISTALSGKCLQKFIQMVGGGRNGKGLSNNLLLKLLGDNANTGYGCTFDASIICGKKNNIGNEIANLGNKRFCKTSEPSKNEGKFNFSKIKKLTGGDKINGRLCFCTKTEHNNNMTLCVEANPQDQLNLDSNGKDEASKDRAIIIPMFSHFSSKKKIVNVNQKNLVDVFQLILIMLQLNLKITMCLLCFTF